MQVVRCFHCPCCAGYHQWLVHEHFYMYFDSYYQILRLQEMIICSLVLNIDMTLQKDLPFKKKKTPEGLKNHSLPFHLNLGSDYMWWAKCLKERKGKKKKKEMFYSNVEIKYSNKKTIKKFNRHDLWEIYGFNESEPKRSAFGPIPSPFLGKVISHPIISR